mmetsp:Transcript_26108/g.36807  ORF Transcript_26108/g.36807 Transcript_26108/m.36807 type:complete len:220 (-) Transcript_26108:128-787(-)
MASSNDIPWAWIKCIEDLVNSSKTNSSHMDEPPSPPVELLPWLWLSDEFTVQRDIVKFKQMGITHVLSLNGMTPHMSKILKSDIEEQGIIHKHIHSEDEEGNDMIGKHWDECKSYLENVRNNVDNGRVVVHCLAGINRTGIIVCAAQMVLERTPILDVVRHSLDTTCGRLLWNRSFQRQLCMLAMKEGLLGEKPTGYTDDPIVLAPPPVAPRNALDRLL